MATILKSTAILGINGSNEGNVVIYPPEDRDQRINNYWGEPTNEKRFPIAIWKIQQLFSASNTNEIALRVSNINNPYLIDATWLVFDGNYQNDLDNDSNDNIYYFVLHEDYFYNIMENPPHPPLRGMYHSIEFPYQAIVWGRIGKEAGEEYTAFFDIADCPIIDPPVGGDGVITGAKIPPPK